MQTVLKTRILGVTIAALTALVNGLTGCDRASQTASTSQMSSPSATQANKPIDHGSMNQGGAPAGTMDHSMSMDLGPSDGEFDLRFIDAMTPHHQGGVEMAKEAQQKSKRPEIKKLAADIIAAQDKELAQMKQWRQAWYPKASAESIAYNSQMGHTMPMTPDQKKGMMMSVDLGAADDQFDRRFLNAMTPHHEGAVTMANDALKNSQRPEVQKLAKDIIAAQQLEISQMKQWRRAWFNQ